MKIKCCRYSALSCAIFMALCVVGLAPDVLAKSKKLSGENKVEFKTVKPGVYDEDEQKLMDATKAYFSGDSNELGEKLAAQRGGKKQVLVLDGEEITLNMELNSGNALVNATLGDNDLLAKAYVLNPLNPLYTDREYSTKIKGAFIAAPFTVDIGPAFPYVPKGTDIWAASDAETTLRGLDHEVIFHKPIYAGDTLQGKLVRQDVEDISDPNGSEIRKLRAIGETELYNQKGDRVMSAVYRGVETYKLFKDRTMVKDYDEPLVIWWAKKVDWEEVRPIHNYTEADWEYIKELWNKEYIRGDNTLYWEDVNVGDEPAWTCDGPITEEDRWNGGGQIRVEKATTVRETMMTPATDEPQGPGPGGGHGPGGRVETYQDEFGIYHVKTGEGGGAPPMGGTQHQNARSSFMNTAGRDYATKFITNWMGNDGWLYKMCWRLSFCMDDGRNMFPADSDRPSYLLKVPYLKEQGKYMNTHGYVGDLAITKGYVCDKYQVGSHHYVELVVWCETIEGDIWAECYAVVELPSASCGD